jgi:hypothetical protein
VTESTPLSGWIEARTPAPPHELIARIASMIGHRSVGDGAADALVDCSVDAMGRLLGGGCLTRESALDLLAVDALVTYAFEGGADEPAALEDRAKRALARVAALAEPYSA